MCKTTCEHRAPNTLGLLSQCDMKVPGLDVVGKISEAVLPVSGMNVYNG